MNGTRSDLVDHALQLSANAADQADTGNDDVSSVSSTGMQQPDSDCDSLYSMWESEDDESSDAEGTQEMVDPIDEVAAVSDREDDESSDTEGTESKGNDKMTTTTEGTKSKGKRKIYDYFSPEQQQQKQEGEEQEKKRKKEEQANRSNAPGSSAMHAAMHIQKRKRKRSDSPNGEDEDTDEKERDENVPRTNEGSQASCLPFSSERATHHATSAVTPCAIPAQSYFALNFARLAGVAISLAFVYGMMDHAAVIANSMGNIDPTQVMSAIRDVMDFHMKVTTFMASLHKWWK